MLLLLHLLELLGSRPCFLAKAAGSFPGAQEVSSGGSAEDVDLDHLCREERAQTQDRLQQEGAQVAPFKVHEGDDGDAEARLEQERAQLRQVVVLDGGRVDGGVLLVKGVGGVRIGKLGRVVVAVDLEVDDQHQHQRDCLDGRVADAQVQRVLGGVQLEPVCELHQPKDQPHVDDGLAHPMGKKTANTRPQPTCDAGLEAYSVGHVLVLVFKTCPSLKAALGRAHAFYEQAVLAGPLLGVNMPTSVYSRWRSSVALTKEELVVDSLIAANVYICCSVTRASLLHEWAHSVYYLNQEYRLLVDSLFAEIALENKQLMRKIHQDLVLRNYHPRVFADEWQAYVVENPADFGSKWTSVLRKYQVMLRKHVTLPNLNQLQKLPVDQSIIQLDTIVGNGG